MKRRSGWWLEYAPRRGMVAVLVAALMPVVVGVMALSLDGGLLYLQRQKAQSAADAAALGGAYQLYNGSNFSVAQASAIAMGSQNGYTIPTSSVTNPQTGYIGVTVTAGQPRLFGALWGSGSASITASAVARGTTTPYSKAAILVLSTSGTDVTFSGSTSIVAVNGSIVVDSTSSSSVTMSGSATITTPELDLSGGITSSGGAANHATVTNYSQPYTPDPLASISPPSTSGLTVQSTSKLNLSNATTTLSPGIYTGGISLSGSSSVTLKPGTYYLNGGGLNLSSSSGIVGDGVLIYNTGGGAIDLSGSGTISLNPMTSGPYAGITIFQDRSNTAAATISGGSNISNTGTFYFPSAAVTLSGGSSIGDMGAQFIVKTLALSGSSSVQVVYGSSVASKSSLALVQ